MEISRKAEARTTATRARAGTKAREIMKLYPKEKAESLIQRLRQKGLWYFDSDFPGDEEDPMVKVKDMFRVTCFKMLNSIRIKLLRKSYVSSGFIPKVV